MTLSQGISKSKPHALRVDTARPSHYIAFVAYLSLPGKTRLEFPSGKGLQVKLTRK
jgi:hypothetical protein